MARTRRSLSVSPSKLSAQKTSPSKQKTTPRRQSAVSQIPAEPDGLKRCAWSYVGSSTLQYRRYHDEEWGVPCQDDSKLMEHVVLDGAQCGLSWATILAKREAYSKAFHAYDISAIAAMGPPDVEKLLEEGSGIVRHRGKIESAISNARIVLEIQQEHGSFATWLWSMLPEKKPVVNTWRTMEEVPTVTPLATDISKALKQRGFKFVGPTMVYSFLQAAGCINDHTTDCFRHAQINALHPHLSLGPASAEPA